MQSANDQLDWRQETWSDIHQAVQHEAFRVEIASKFLPLYGPMPEALTVTSDTIVVGPDEPFLLVDEAATYPLVEIWVDFTLTPQQVEDEMNLMTARTLAIRATNYLSLGKDSLIFQGQSVTPADPLFTENRVRFRSGPAGPGLLNAPKTEEQVITIEALGAGQPAFRERTVAGVTEGYARLQLKGHYGPYALILHDVPYGDLFAPLPGTLFMAIDRLRPLMNAGIYGTGTLPADATTFSGLLISLGGNSMDLAVGRDSLATYLFEDGEGLYRFRIWERFALRLKDPSAIIQLDFTAA